MGQKSLVLARNSAIDRLSDNQHAHQLTEDDEDDYDDDDADLHELEVAPCETYMTHDSLH